MQRRAVCEMGATAFIENELVWAKRSANTFWGRKRGYAKEKGTHPRSSSTIIRIARTALTMITKGHRNLHTLVQM